MSGVEGVPESHKQCIAAMGRLSTVGVRYIFLLVSISSIDFKVLLYLRPGYVIELVSHLDNKTSVDEFFNR